jgi:hypothetical protein
MADLTIGEIGKTLQLNLSFVDQTQNPPVQSPLDLTNVSSVALSFVITDISAKPSPPVKTVQMTINSPATAGIVQYIFLAGDLAKPSNMGKNGVFRYSVEVTYANGNILNPSNDGLLSIKDDSVL